MMRNAKIRMAAMAALALGAGLSGCNKDEGPQGHNVAAGPAELKDAIQLTGTVEPVVQVALQSEVSGRIERILVEEGDSVKQGQLLVELDGETYRLKRDRAALVVDQCRLALRTAQRDLERAQALVPSGTVSKDAVEDLVTARDKAQLDLRDAELSYKETLKDLADTRIVAPMDGRLISLDVEVGQTVAAVGSNSTDTIAVVADPRRMEVEVEVGELDYPNLKLGMPVEVTSEAVPGKVLHGKVSFVSSSARANSSSIQVFPVKVTVEDAGDILVSGMTVSVDFVFLQEKVAVAVPYAAVKTGQKDGEGMVMVQGADREGKVRVHPSKITLGRTDYRHYEVLGGLKAGDSVFVVQSGSSSKRDGAGGPPGGGPGGP